MQSAFQRHCSISTKRCAALATTGDIRGKKLYFCRNPAWPLHVRALESLLILYCLCNTVVPNADELGFLVRYAWVYGGMMQSENMRRHMVDSQLRTSGVNEPWVIQAMRALPRENFVPAERASVAYADRPVPLSAGRMLNAPVVAGLMLQAASPENGDTALVVGAGTGYLAALLAPQVSALVAVESDAALAALTRSNVPAVTVVEGPLEHGAPDTAPYSLIIIDGAIKDLSAALVAQLADGGRIVAGLVEGAVCRLAMGVKHGSHVALRPFADGEVVPLSGFARSTEFVF
jgi:protein-L-isoaspartate(D-aspartate) O-methyltransferase